MMDLRLKISAFVFCISLFFGNGFPLLAQDEFSLNGTWQFKTDPNDLGETEAWFLSYVDRSGWEEMEVPGNWDLYNAYAHYVGKGWYTKTFSLPSDWEGKSVIINFEGVYHDCTVWLNGKKLGDNNSGFLPFEFEVTDLLYPDQENTLTVRADNTFKRGAIWNWGGIRRPVTLTAFDGLRIIRQHITPRVDAGKKEAEVAIRIFFENLNAESTVAEGEVLLSAGNGYRQVLPFSTSISANGEKEIVLTTPIKKKDVRLWHFDDPFLYESAIILKTQQKPAVNDAFGLRKVELDTANYRLLLNGESVRLMGLNLVPDARTTGNTLPLWQIKRDVDLLKSLNGNFARLSHLPLPEEMLNYLDQRGILIISEIPLWGFDSLANPDNDVPFNWLDRLVNWQYNHPSVVGWSTGNELGHYPSADAYVKKSIAYARTLDSTRMVTAVSHMANSADDYIQYSDMGLINKYGKNLAPVTRLQHANHPGKVLFYSEYGIGQFGEGLDATFAINPLLDSIRNFPYLVGASIWTYNDYRSSYDNTQQFSENRPWGVVDVYRRKKQAFFDLQKEHAPVREMVVDVLGKTANITVFPRTVLDLPAHPVSAYKIVYQLLDADENPTVGGIENLPTILPGDNPLSFKIDWEAEGAHALKVSLLTPQMDTVLDTVIYFRKPVQKIQFNAYGGRTLHNMIAPKTGGIRVFYKKIPHATHYKVKYGKNQLDQETVPSIEVFLDIDSLDVDQTYMVQVVAINALGESLSEPMAVNINSRQFLPPGVRHVEATNEGFFVGYASDEMDFLYRTRYRDEHGDEKIIQSRTPGLMAVRGLTNGKPYSFEVQRVMNNNSSSLWGKTYTVIPDGNQKPAPPTLKGAFRNGKEVVVSFLPVGKAIAYEIQYRESGTSEDNWNAVYLNRTEVYFGHINSLKPNRSYEFRMATINENGKSDFTKVIGI
ncbi:glycoside hydrolase family 2 TIM barrel-domain containing protein [Cyclobacterium xiamenense]|uniref:glycoside hydrolase family 2 TIM barrel-domain containing protein n=1 Tax=Cyclobacterium xiamenense TaxID=1297121 RepID=UPI0035CE97BD